MSKLNRTVASLTATATLLLAPYSVAIAATLPSSAAGPSASNTALLPGNGDAADHNDHAACPGSLEQRVSSLESTLFGKAGSGPLATRLDKLDNAMFGHLQQGSLAMRTQRLEATLAESASQKPLALSPEIEQQIPAPFLPAAAEQSAANGATLKATVQTNSLSGDATGTNQPPVPPFFRQAQATATRPFNTGAAMAAPPAPLPPPQQFTTLVHKGHPKLKAFARDFGKALVVTLKTAALVAGTAAAAYANTSASYGYGGYSSPVVDTCACPANNGI